MADLLASTPRPPTPDQALVEAALHHADQPLTVEELARSLEWALPRVVEALDALQASTGSRGSVVRSTVDGAYRLAPASHLLPPAARARLKAQPATALSAREFALLRRVVRGEVGPGWEAEEARAGQARYALTRLLRAGLVEVKNGRLVASEEVRYSLGQ